LLSRDSLTQKQQSKVQTILSSGRALLKLLEDVLDISRIEAGLMSLSIAPETPRTLLEDTRAIIAGPALLKGLEVHVKAGEDVDTPFMCDPKRTRQVLANLAGNAVKFTRTGAVTIGQYRQGERIRFEIADTGPGVDPTLRETIFQRFRQADSSSARSHDRAGLGLAISRELIELAGGRIGLEDNPDGGSVFWFDLPYIPVEAPETEAA